MSIRNKLKSAYIKAETIVGWYIIGTIVIITVIKEELKKDYNLKD